MDYVEIRGNRIPKLGFGTWQLKDDNCTRGVKTALEEGYRHVDTAQIYGNERQVGKGISQSEVDRDDIWLTTKIWRDSLNKDDLQKSVEKSLEKLQTDYVDLLLIHWPFAEMNMREALSEMDELVEKGKARSIGVSNFTPDQMDRAQEVSENKLLTNQVEYHPFLDQNDVVRKCMEQEMMLTAYSPLARGSVMGNKALQKIGEKYGKSEAQVSLRWLIQQEGIVAIPKASSPEHIRANLDIFDFELTGREMKTVSELADNNRKVNPDFGPWR